MWRSEADSNKNTQNIHFQYFNLSKNCQGTNWGTNWGTN
jgi:hypothetical protein